VKLYEEFTVWWYGRNTVAIPSRKNFFRLVPSKYLRVKFAGAVAFRELRIRPEAVG
jgi:hypothetical protein